MRNPQLLLLLLVMTCSFSVGCTIRLSGWGGTTSDSNGASGYRGSECDTFRKADRLDSQTSMRMRRDQGQHLLRYSRLPEHDERTQVTSLTCADETTHRLYGGGIAASSALAKDHYAFHDRRFDHLRAAIMVVDCGMDAGCEKDRVGPMHWYAEKVQPKRVIAALKRTGVAPELSKAFMARLEEAQATINKRVAQLDARRQYMYVEVPRAVCDERERFYGEHADLYGQLNELLVRAKSAKDQREVPSKLLDDLVRLRDAYFKRCAGEQCRHDLFSIEITEQLVVLAMVADDDGLALVEERLLREDGARIQQFSAAVLAAMMLATKEENANWKKYDRAKRSGVDEAVLAAKFGEPPPVHVSANAPWFSWGKGQRPNYLAAVDSKSYRSAFGNVRSVVKKGDMATIHFADRITKYEDADCYETGRIVAIRSNGSLVYQRHCTNFRTKVIRDKVKSIVVPASETVGLKPGEGVLALVTGSERTGYVLSAKRKARLTQYRGHRIKPAPAGAAPDKRKKS